MSRIKIDDKNEEEVYHKNCVYFVNDLFFFAVVVVVVVVTTFPFIVKLSSFVFASVLFEIIVKTHKESTLNCAVKQI